MKPSSPTATPTPAPTADPATWAVRDADTLYGVSKWGLGYFGINDAGQLVALPDWHGKAPGQQPGIVLADLVDELRRRDLSTPLLLRFSDILKHRLRSIAQAFGSAMDKFGYDAGYRCVYPIKVNQQRHVVEEILDFGKSLGFGLEAGSKPELLAVMALVDDPDTPIVCNGFKDDQFIEAVILAAKLGRNIVPVVEKFSELRLIIKHAKRHGVRPKIGIRVKLAARGAGKWQGSAGVHSKFGLFVSEVIDAADLLQQEGMLDCLSLAHFHLGSQCSDIRGVKQAIAEQVRVYAELRGMGATGLSTIDIGGGLGVDYDGSQTNSDASMNYTLQEYADDVVYHVKQVCDDAEVPHPEIISESGRAMVAYSSVLVFEVTGWSGFERFAPPRDLPESELDAMPQPVRDLYDAHAELSETNFNECYHDATAARDATLHLFNLGYCSLAHRGLAERLYYDLCARVLRIVRHLDYVPPEFAELEPLLCNTYFCNTSIFQSMPDSWAIDQVFPVMPIHRLDEAPTCRGVLADITCDSDGTINRFIAQRGDRPKPVLELHPYTGDRYLLAAFMVGAYQETLGDLHNLFGDTNAVHVSIDDDGKASIDEIVEGDTIAEVLRYVQYDPEQLRRDFRRSVERAVKAGKLTVDESSVLRRFYEQGLAGSTYLQ